jgi:hypothetical protein
MSIRNAEPRTNDSQLERMRRKRDQAWDMAGLARQDGDTKDEKRHTDEAIEWENKIKEYLS